MQFILSNVVSDFFANIEDWWIQITAAIVVITLWIARIKNLYSKSCSFCKSIVRFFSFQRILTERMDKQDRALEFIKGELSFNGGGSTKDLAKNSYELALLSSMRTRHIVMINPIPMYECDKDGRFILANTALCELFGLSEQEILGNGWLAAIAPEDRHSCWENYQHAIKSDIPFEWVYTVVNYKTHQRVRCKTEMTVLRDAKGKPVVYQGYVEKLSSNS